VAGPPPPHAALRAFAVANGVSAEIRPHYEVRDHRCLRTGLDLALLTPRPRECARDPGCTACERTHALLLEIGHAVVPPGWRAVAEAFEAAFRYRRETAWRPEIEAVVEILPPEGTGPAASPEPGRELAGIRARLRALGVRDEAQPPVGRAA
jgi:hypothetical protein